MKHAGDGVAAATRKLQNLRVMGQRPGPLLDHLRADQGSIAHLQKLMGVGFVGACKISWARVMAGSGSRRRLPHIKIIAQ